MNKDLIKHLRTLAHNLADVRNALADAADGLERANEEIDRRSTPLMEELSTAIRKAQIIGGSERAQIKYTQGFFAKACRELIGPEPIEDDVEPAILAESAALIKATANQQFNGVK